MLRSSCGRVIGFVTSLSLVGLLFAIVHPGQPASPPQPVVEKTITACAAVTRADVELALGRPVAGGKEERDGAASTCDYDGGAGQVTITVQRLAVKLDIPAEMAALKAAIPDSNAREAAGIGARAFFLDIAGAGTQLHVIHGERNYLMVSVLGFGEAAEVSAAAERMARKALARL